MPAITVVNKRSDVPSNWEDSSKFYSKEAVVDAQGKRIAPGFKGDRYRIISKKNYPFTPFERSVRGFIALAFAIVLIVSYIFRNYLGFSLASLVILPEFRNFLSTAFAKTQAVRFAVLDQTAAQYAQSENEIQQGLSLSLKDFENLKQCIQADFTGPGVRHYFSKHTQVFSLASVPGIIFKRAGQSRFDDMIRARTTIREDHLDHLVLPRAKMISVQVSGDPCNIIVEQKLDIDHDTADQEEHFEEHATSLNEAIRQLAIFICKTGYADVEWRNNPMLNNSGDTLGRRKIALVDVDGSGFPETGLFGGGLYINGLLSQVSLEQGRMIAAIAKENGVNTTPFENAYRYREAVIEKRKQLKQLYAEKRLTCPNQLVKFDVEILECSKYPEKIRLFREIAKEVIQEINLKIAENAQEKKTVKGIRSIQLVHRKEPFYRWGNFLKAFDKTPTNMELLFNTHLGHVLRLLHEAKVILQIDCYTGHEVIFQV